MLAADAGVAVGHVGRTLLVHDRHELDAGRREDVHCVHERAAHDAEGRGDAIGHHRLDEGLGRSHTGHVVVPLDWLAVEPVKSGRESP